ncbi:hypothetical protein [Klebsiella oxytoca]|uniref:hypothetical protein n=1 Tax=Klebsiella oxytoca TaxID=571 RepID=UPI00384CD9C7
MNTNLFFKWKNDLQEEAQTTDSVPEEEPLPVELTSVSEPVNPATNPFWRKLTGDGQPGCELHLKAGVVNSSTR